MTPYLIRTLVMFQTWLTNPTTVRDERGSISTEEAVIAAALVLLAIGITAALASYAMGQVALLR